MGQGTVLRGQYPFCIRQVWGLFHATSYRKVGIKKEFLSRVLIPEPALVLRRICMSKGQDYLPGAGGGGTIFFC